MRLPAEPADAAPRAADRHRPPLLRELRQRFRLDASLLPTAAAFALGLIASPLVMVLLAGALTRLYGGLDSTGEYGLAVATTRRLASALDRYRARHQRMPDAKLGLAALVPEFVDRVPEDPWGAPYIYDTTGPDWADVLSYGADRRAGGVGPGVDISARFGRLGPRPPGWLRSFATLLLMGLALGATVGTVRYRWSAAALAGITAFWGLLLLATMSGTLWGSLMTPLALAAGMASLTASVALLQNLRHARLVALVSIVAAYSVLQYLVSG